MKQHHIYNSKDRQGRKNEFKGGYDAVHGGGGSGGF